MLEHPGPWGSLALHSTRLPVGLGRGLRTLSAELGVRVVLIRRHRPRRSDGGASCFLAHTGPGQPWLERLSLRAPEDLLEFDLRPLAEGRPPGVGTPDQEPLFL